MKKVFFYFRRGSLSFGNLNELVFRDIIEVIGKFLVYKILFFK